MAEDDNKPISSRVLDDDWNLTAPEFEWSDPNEVSEQEELHPQDDVLRYYFNQAGTHSILTREEERRLFILYSETKNLEIREKIVAHNIRLVVSVAKRYRGRGVDFLDLIQEGNLGLLTALEKFDVSRGYKFSTYAVPWIRQKVARVVEEHGRTIRIPCHMYHNLRDLWKLKNNFQHKHGRMPNREETFRLAKKTLRIFRAIEKAEVCGTIPIDTVIAHSVSDGGELRISDIIPDVKEGASLTIEAKLELVRAKAEVEELNRALSFRASSLHTSVFRSLYGLDDGTLKRKKLKKVAMRFGVTHQNVAIIERQVCRRLGKTVLEMRGLFESIENLSEIVSTLEMM